MRSVTLASVVLLGFVPSGQAAPPTPPSVTGGAGGTLAASRGIFSQDHPVTTSPALEDSYRPSQMSPPATDDMISLKTLRVQGVTALPRQTVEGLIAPIRGRAVRFAEIQAVADKITEAYGRAGYGLSFAVVPEQSFDDGVVRIVVVEVFIDKVTIEMSRSAFSLVGRRRIHDLLQRQADTLQGERPVQSAHIESILLALNDLAGINAHAVVRRGTRGQGAANLVIQVDVKGLSAAASIDNRLRTEFGRYTYSATASLTSLGFVGDEVTVGLSQGQSSKDFSSWQMNNIPNGKSTSAIK